MTTTLEQRLTDYADSHRDDLVRLIGDLVRCPSENTPPVGREAACQQYARGVLERAGYSPELYELGSVPGLPDPKAEAIPAYS